MVIRNVKETIKGQETYDGAGVKLIRVLGPNNINEIDPFLMLDAFDSEDRHCKKFCAYHNY